LDGGKFWVRETDDKRPSLHWGMRKHKRDASKFEDDDVIYVLTRAKVGVATTSILRYARPYTHLHSMKVRPIYYKPMLRPTI
jgi:hypothetical protein